jgi:hypothetical protein
MSCLIQTTRLQGYRINSNYILASLAGEDDPEVNQVSDIKELLSCTQNGLHFNHERIFSIDVLKSLVNIFINELLK